MNTADKRDRLIFIDGNPTPRCPVCAMEAAQLFRPGLYDDRYGFPGHFDLFECSACTHRFLNARFSDAELQRLYSDYYPRSSRTLDSWEPHREFGVCRTWLGRHKSSAFRWVPRNCRVLDVGCGFGESLGYHRSRGCKVVGVETDENIVRVAEAKGFDVRVGVFHATDFSPSSFDCVTLDQVIEHTRDPLALLRDAGTVLRPGGMVVLSTPNARSLSSWLLGRRWVHFHTPYHLQLFTRRSLIVAAGASGLRVEEIRQITNPRWYGFQWLHCLVRPRPGAPSPFWTAAPSWRYGRRLVRKVLSVLEQLGMNHGVAMLLDGMSVGDNLVAVLRKDRE